MSSSYRESDVEYLAPLVAARMRAGGGRPLEDPEFDLCASEAALLASKLPDGLSFETTYAFRRAAGEVAALFIERSGGRALTDEDVVRCVEAVKAMRKAVRDRAGAKERFDERLGRLRDAVDGRVAQLNLAGHLDGDLPDGAARAKPRL